MNEFGQTDMFQPSENQLREWIANRAYFISLERGGQSNREVEDWLQAEAEILTRLRSGEFSSAAAEQPAIETQVAAAWSGEREMEPVEEAVTSSSNERGAQKTRRARASSKRVTPSKKSSRSRKQPTESE